MRIVKATAEIINDKVTTNLPNLIEIAGRTCYKSEEKITEDSNINFINMLITRQHGAMLEHGVIVLEISSQLYEALRLMDFNNDDNKLLKFISMSNVVKPIMSFNIRAIRDLFFNVDDVHKILIMGIMAKIVDIYPNYDILFKDILALIKEKESKLINKLFNKDSIKAIEDWQTLNKEEQKLHGYLTFKIVCDRGVTHEIVRHRVASYAQESTRYCNYSKAKFGNELTFVEPLFWNEKEKKTIFLGETIDDGLEVLENKYTIWQNTLEYIEDMYLTLIKEGATPQEARSILPNSLKTEIVVTMSLGELELFYNLRAAPTAHPQMVEIASQMLELSKPYGFSRND